MTIGESLRSVARNLISTVFGNTIAIHSYSDATKNYDDEGNETITWGDAVSGSCIMTDFIPKMIEVAPQFEETLGSADMIVRDDLTVGLKDKIVFNEVNYQVDSIDETSRMNDVLILQSLKLHRMEDQS